MPWPLSRKRWPFWVPGGIFRRTLPLSVVTGTSPPRSASARVIGSSRSRSAPFRVNTGCGRTFDRDDEVAAARALAGQLDLRPVVGAAGDRHVEPAAVDLDPAGRAVVGLLEADLGDGLGGRAAARRRPAGAPARRPARRRRSRPAGSGPSRRGCRRTTARRSARRPRPGPVAAAVDRLGVAAEEDPEEVGEVARRSPPLVRNS